MSSEQDNKDLHREFYKRIVDSGDVDAIDELLTEDWIGHGTVGPPMDRTGFKQTMASINSAFPDSVVQIEHQVAEADIVASHITVSGTHTGDFMGLPATGRKVEYPGIEIVRVRDRKIAEYWGLFDLLTLMQQLGVAPGPGDSPG